jgi:hypothetical protein
MSEAHPIALVAMGGHAFMQPGERGTIDDHERNAARIAALLLTLVEREYHVCITHGSRSARATRFPPCRSTCSWR